MKMTKQKGDLSERNLGFFKRKNPGATVYIGNLSFNSDENSIKKLFTPFGRVNFVKLVLDTKTYKSKGIAFVQMPEKDEAQAAIQYLNGRQISGRTLKVSIAIENKIHKKQDSKAIQAPVQTVPVTEKIKPKNKPIKKKDKGLKVLFNYLNA